MARSDDITPAVEAAMAVSRVLHGISGRSAAELPHELTLPQLRALVVLDDDAVVTVKALAERLGIQPSTTTRLIDRLVAKRLIERAPGVEDRREVLLSLSRSGRRVVDQSMQFRRQAIREILESLTRAERASVLDAFAVFAAAGESLADPLALDAL
ncbi:MAG TPA: MarR family transcriptional regulator [Acidimicrobiia bacterium]|jgi:DNA-binding MarR family transcriptional regulator